eukprot:g13818.t2
MDEIGSEESFQDVPAIQLPITDEERLLRKLGEVDRFVANITAELQKSEPCQGAIRRELMERELEALNRDRESIEKKLGLLLSSFAVARKEESYEQKHGDSPPDIVPVANTNDNTSSSTGVGEAPERARERPPPSVAPSRTETDDRNGGNLAPHKRRKSNSVSSGHDASTAPPGEVSQPDGGDSGGGREVSPAGLPRAGRSCSALGEHDQYLDSIRQGDRGRRASAPFRLREVVVDADQRKHHPQQDEHRPDQPEWAVMGGRARGREDRQYRVGVGESVQAVGANPAPEGFFDANHNGGHFSYSYGIPDGVFRGRRRTEPQLPERGASRARSQQEQGGAVSTNGTRGGLFRAPKVASLIRDNAAQQFAPPPAHDPLPTRASQLRGTPRQFEGGSFSFHPVDGDREGLRLKRRPVRQYEEPVGTSGQAWRAAPPAWAVEKGGSEEAGTRAAYGSARVSVPVAMTVDNHHVDRPRSDSHHSAYHGGSSRHVDTSRVLDDRRAGHSGHDSSTKRFANNGRYPTSNSSNQRCVDSSNTGYNRAYGGRGNRAVDTNMHVHNQPYWDSSRFVDNDSRQTPHGYDSVESRSGKRGRWYQQGQEPEREQRTFQAGALHYSPHQLGRVAPSNESSGWAREKLDAHGLTAQSPTH